MSKSTPKGRKPSAKRVTKQPAKPTASLHNQGGRHAPMQPVADLWFGQLDSRPQSYSWGYGETSGYGTRWESHEASRCEECGAIVLGNGGEKHCDADSESECAGYIPEQSGPMMSYFYGLEDLRSDFDPAEAAKAIVDLPLCVIEWQGDEQDNHSGGYALALTGGGTDLTWEICEAFMRLGYLPPVHFASQLPGICGRGMTTNGGDKAKTITELDAWIVAGCRRSLQGKKEQVGRALRNLRETYGTAAGESTTEGEG